MREIASKTLPVDRAASTAAKQGRRDLPAIAIDAVGERPGNQPDAGHRFQGLRIDLIRTEAGDEGGRTQGVRDESGRDPRRVVGAYRRQRQRAAQYGRHKQDDFVSSGHGVLRWSRAIMACRTSPQRRRKRSPDLQITEGENSTHLADFEIVPFLQLVISQARASLRRRYSLGVTPVVALKARLKGPSD